MSLDFVNDADVAAIGYESGHLSVFDMRTTSLLMESRVHQDPRGSTDHSLVL